MSALLQSAPMNLSEPQKKYLRGRGHALKPLIIVGDAGLSDSLISEFNSTIAHHELIKVRVRGGDRDVRDETIQKLCDQSDASLVQHIGNVALVYKANTKKKPEARLRIPSN